MLDLREFVVVNGKSGVHKLVAARGNGIIIEDVDSKMRSFAQVRQHEFTPLAGIQIYTTTETSVIQLAEVFGKIKDQIEANPLPSEKSTSPELRAYFTAVVPEHDATQVHISDIKKIVKWFGFLNSRDLLKEAPASEETAAETAQ